MRLQPGLRDKLLSVVVIVLTANAAVTALHYILLFLDVIPIRGSEEAVVEFAVADGIGTILPSCLGAWGLWHLKAWGPVLALLAGGGYVHGMVVLLTRFATTGQGGAMPLVAVYFLAFRALLATVVWRRHHVFS